MRMYSLCVAQFGQSPRLGTEMPLVRIQPHRLYIFILSVAQSGSVPGLEPGGLSSNLGRETKYGTDGETGLPARL